MPGDRNRVAGSICGLKGSSSSIVHGQVAHCAKLGYIDTAIFLLEEAQRRARLQLVLPKTYLALADEVQKHGDVEVAEQLRERGRQVHREQRSQ